MIIIKSVGFTVKREHTPLEDIFDMLNEMYRTHIINGYLVEIKNGVTIINIIERG